MENNLPTLMPDLPKLVHGIEENRTLSRNRHHDRRQKGQSMVEMAFVLPLFLAMVFSIIEIGRAWSTRHSLTMAAREGARVLILPYGAGLSYSNESTQQQAAIDTVKSYLNNSGVVVTNDTQVTPVRFLPGSDNVLGTADDQIVQNYSNAKRGDRIGIQIKYTFETPLAAILTLFSRDSGTPSGSDNTTSGQIKMGVRCILEHE